MTSTETKTSDLRGYLPTLDGWRAVAITIVLMYHSRDALVRVFGASIAGFDQRWPLLGPFGVDLFFAISGLLITSRLLNEESKPGGISLKSFYIRRAFRILPPSLTYLAVVALLGSLGVIAFRLNSWLGALFFYVNYTTAPIWYVGHFWSLAVEEHFYAFWPALLVFVKAKYRFSVALVLCFLVLVWRVLNFKYAAIGLAMGSDYFSHQHRTDFQLDGILWGAALALAYKAFSHRRAVRRALTLPVGLILFVLVLGSLLTTAGWKLDQGLLLFREVATPVILLITILNCRGIVAVLLENRLLKHIGRLSYSLYLWQQLFLIWDIETLPHVVWMQRFPFNLCCAYSCALASYYLLEKPFIKVGHRIAKRLESRQISDVRAQAVA